MMWRVDKHNGRRWIPTGIKESNFPWASVWWAELGRRWNVRYRLIEES